MARAQPISEVMTSPVATVGPDDSLEDVLAVLAEHGISGIPVADAEGRLLGVLDDTDLIVSEARLHAPTTIEILGAYLPLPGESRRFSEEVRHALGRTAREVMHGPEIAVPVTGTVEDVATMMLDQDVSRVPIIDEDRRIVGIVTRGDLVRALGRS